jgi:hypothetical protein
MVRSPIRLLALSLFPAVLTTSAPAGDDLPIGPDLSSWRQAGEWIVTGGAAVDPADDKRLLPMPGTGSILNGKGVTRDLVTVKEYGDIEAHIEFTVPRGSNSGVYFMGRYEVQVLDSWDAAAGKPKEKPSYSDCGGIYERWDDARGPGKEGYEGHPPRSSAARKPGEWQTFDVLFRAPRFDASGKKTENARFVRVVHNGVLIHENVEVTGPTRAAAFQDEKPLGPLMLQGDHGPVAYRRIAIRPVDLGAGGFPREKFDDAGSVSIFDGKTLAGWHVSAKTGHSRASGNKTGGRWVVEDGAIVGSQDIPGNGGIVITDAKYGDFEVACEMRNDYGPDSGFFLRSTEEGVAYQYLVDYHGDGNLAGLYGEGMRRGFHIRNFNLLDTPEKIKEVECLTFPLPVKPADWARFWRHGQWNELRVRIEGNPPKIVTWINGVRFMEWQDTEKRHVETGGIAFQVHGGGDGTKQFVRYRKVRIKEL